MGTTAPAPLPRRRRGKRPNYWLRRLTVLLVLLSPFLGWWGWSTLQHSLTFASEGTAPRVAVNKPVYVVVLGVDQRTDDTGRSDTLILARLDANAQSLHLINIPRDTRVTLPGEDSSKINAAYSQGGAERVTRAVGDLLQIPQPYYVKVDFQSFEEIIDELGGVALTVDQHYVYDDPYQDLHIDIPAGRQVLYGRTALHFVRMRYDGVTNSDLGRIQRQQQFITALKEKLSAPSSWLKAPDLLKVARRYVTTNIPEQDQLRLVEAAFQARENLQIQVLPGSIEGADWILDKAQWSEVVRAWSP